MADPEPAAGRVRFARKSDWASARADDLQKQALELRFTSSDGSTRRAARKYRGVTHLESEAARFRDIARRLREKGQ